MRLSMTGYRHKMLSNYYIIAISYCMDHFFFPSDAADSADT